MEIAKRLKTVLPKNMESALTFACSYEIDLEDEVLGMKSVDSNVLVAKHLLFTKQC
jgi:hypothetical protein